MNLKLTDPEYQIAPRALTTTDKSCCALAADKTHPVLLFLTFALLALAQIFFAGYELI